MMASPDLPNAKYDHAFAILRIDFTEDRDFISPDHITVKKVVWSEKIAQQEVNRLNELNADKGCQYFYQLTRIERKNVI